MFVRSFVITCIASGCFVHHVVRPKTHLPPYEEQISTVTHYATDEYMTSPSYSRWFYVHLGEPVYIERDSGTAFSFGGLEP